MINITNITTKIIGLTAVLGFTFNLNAAEVDLSKSTFTWTGSKVTGSKEAGGVTLKSAKVEQKKDGKLKHGEFIIDLNTMSVTKLTGEWKTKFLQHMKSADFFDVSKYPTAKLIVSKDDGKKLTGKLTIKGKTQPVSIAYKKVGKSYKGQLTFDRTKFGIIYGSGSFFKNLGDKMIDNKVSLNFNIQVK